MVGIPLSVLLVMVVHVGLVVVTLHMKSEIGFAVSHRVVDVFVFGEGFRIPEVGGCFVAANCEDEVQKVAASNDTR